MLAELQRLLRDTHLTHREIREQTGLSLSLIAAIKSGDKPNPTIETYQRLHDCLTGAAPIKRRKKAA